MPYISSVERIGIRKGLQQGRQGSIIRILEVRFEDIPQELALPDLLCQTVS